jgi:hypothetical protein
MYANLLLLIATTVIFGYLWQQARAGNIPTIRRLQALDAIEDAVGRCAEMGRPLMYSMGSRADFEPGNAAETYASLSLVNYTATLCARNDVGYYAHCGRAIGVPATHDAIRSAYVAEGKAEAFRHEMVVYGSDETKAAEVFVGGIMAREECAALVIIGGLGTEGQYLPVLADRMGMFIVGGSTKGVTWIIAIADHYLIKEEVLAAGAYVSKDPLQSASVAAVDWVKYISLAVILIGSVLMWAGVPAIADLLAM